MGPRWGLTPYSLEYLLLASRIPPPALPKNFNSKLPIFKKLYYFWEKVYSLKSLDTCEFQPTLVATYHAMSCLVLVAAATTAFYRSYHISHFLPLLMSSHVVWLTSSLSQQPPLLHTKALNSLQLQQVLSSQFSSNVFLTYRFIKN